MMGTWTFCFGKFILLIGAVVFVCLGLAAVFYAIRITFRSIEATKKLRVIEEQKKIMSETQRRNLARKKKMRADRESRAAQKAKEERERKAREASAARKKKAMDLAKLAVLVFTMFAIMGDVQVDAKLLIEAVSPYKACFNPGSNGGFNCSATDSVTIVEAQVSSSVSVSEIDPVTSLIEFSDQAGVFEADFTVVPSLEQINAAFASGTSPDGSIPTNSLNKCTAKDGQACQTTVPVKITYEMLPPVYRYDLIELPSNLYTNLWSPWGYIYENMMVVPNQYWVSYGKSFQIDKSKITNRTVCRLVDVASGVSSSQQPYPTNQTMNKMFANSTLNEAYLRCPRPSTDVPPPIPKPPQGVGKVGGSMMRYVFDCALNGNVNDFSHNNIFTASLSAQFAPLGPSCRIYSVRNPSVVSAFIRINATVLANYTNLGLKAGDRETLVLRTLPNGLVGTSAVSTPNGYMYASVLDVVTPSGSYGPYITDWLVTCGDDPVNPGYLTMKPDPRLSNPLVQESTGNAAPVVAPEIANPWLYQPNSPFGAGRLPTPTSMAYMSGAAGSHALMYFLNQTQYGTVCRECGCMCVNPDIYRDPPSELQLSAVQAQAKNFTFPFYSLVPIVQGGEGKFQDFLTCVPDRGLTNKGPVTMPCVAAADFDVAEKKMADLLAQNKLNEIRLMRIPHMIRYWDPLRPNVYKSGPYLFLQPTPERGSAVGDITAMTTLSFSGKMLGYAQQVPTGEIQLNITDTSTGIITPTTYCGVSWSGDNPGTILGAVDFRVCNPSNTSNAPLANGPSPASYSISIQCGLASLYSTQQEFFFAGPDGLNRTLLTDYTPSSINLIGVQPGKCQSSGSLEEALYFQGIFSINSQTPVSDTDSVYNTLVKQNGVSCLIRLLSQQTIIPSSMIVDEKYIFCNIANTTGKNPSDLPVVAPPSARPVISILTPTVTATRTPLRTVSPSPRPPLVTQTDKAIFYSTIIVLVFIGIVIIIIACIAGRRRRVPS